jgi:hypothetical protein
MFNSRASKNEKVPSATESATRAKNGAFPVMREDAIHLPETAPARRTTRFIASTARFLQKKKNMPCLPRK